MASKGGITNIVNNKLEIDMAAYEQQGRINLSMFFALTYGFGFATIAAALTHVSCFYRREIYDRFRASYKGTDDIHTKLMRNYEDIPGWWFHLLTVLIVLFSLILCIFLKDQVQLPWWGLLFACGMAFLFTLPISIITATTNQTPGLNVITSHFVGFIQSGKPISIVCFKVYGYMSMAQGCCLPCRFQAWPLHEDTTQIHVLSSGNLFDEAKNHHIVKYVYVWHALVEYWGGVKPAAEGMEHYDTLLAYPVQSPGVIGNQPDIVMDSLSVHGLGLVHPKKVYNFYSELHQYLASCGVDRIKVDVQNIIETLGAGRGRLHTALHRGLKSTR